MKTQLAAPLVEYLEILPAQFGTEAGILGAAHLALNTHFGETFLSLIHIWSGIYGRHAKAEAFPG